MTTPPPPERACRTALFVSPSEPLRLVDLPIPHPEAGEALVRIECCTLCGSDLHTITGARSEASPSVLGHEILGTVCQVAESPLCDVNGRPLEVGQRVTWSACITCGRCDRCQSGLSPKCREVAKYGHLRATGRQSLSGGLAEYILLRAGSAVVRLPEGVEDSVLCPVNCATATVAAAFRQAGDARGKRVLIFGAGMLGLTAIAWASVSQAARVTVCEADSRRHALADRFGADHVVDASADPETLHQNLSAKGSDEFDIVFEVSGSPDAVEAAFRHTAIGGRVVLVGSVFDTRKVNIDPQQIVRRWMTVFGVHNYDAEDLSNAVQFLADHHASFPFADLVEKSYPLSEINGAIEYALAQRPVRVAIRPTR